MIDIFLYMCCWNGRGASGCDLPIMKGFRSHFGSSLLLIIRSGLSLCSLFRVLFLLALSACASAGKGDLQGTACSPGDYEDPLQHHCLRRDAPEVHLRVVRQVHSQLEEEVRRLRAQGMLGVRRASNDAKELKVAMCAQQLR